MDSVWLQVWPGSTFSFMWNMTIGDERYSKNMRRHIGRTPNNIKTSKPWKRRHSRARMSSLVASHARTYQLPETAPVWEKARALVCGSTSGDLLAIFDHEQLSWRMSQGFSLWGEVQLLQTLPPWGMWGAGVLFRLPMPVRPTSVNGFSLWPMPSKTDNRVRSINPDKVLVRKSGAIRYINPKTTGSGSTTQVRLSQAVQYQKRWPTPTKADAKAGRNTQKNRALYGSGDTLTDALRKSDEPMPMNPDWEEMLMGLPPGWTDLRVGLPIRIRRSIPTNHLVLSRRERRRIARAASKR